MYIALSPSYSIRNEEDTSFLIKVEKIIDVDQKSFGAFCIPPFMGYILAHIGDQKYPESILSISAALNVSPNAIKNFVEQLIENPESKNFKISETLSVILPSKLLIKSSQIPVPNVNEEKNFDRFAPYTVKRPSVPLYANLMVTTDCTTDCLYCYADRTLRPSLKTDKIIGIIKELSDQGTINLTLTGGDIFAHKDWHIILKHVRQYGYKPFLSTKTPLTLEQIQWLRSLGYEELQFSLDSSSIAVLERLIKVKEDYLDKVTSFLRNCSELGLNVLIRSVLTKHNASKNMLEKLYTYLTQFKCIKEWVMIPAFFSKYKQHYYKSLEVSNDDLIYAYELKKRDNLAFKVGVSKISEKGYVLKRFECTEDYVCRNQICMANTTCLSILANGDCSICEMLYGDPAYILGNVNLSTIREIWNSPKALGLYTMQQKEFPLSSPCRTCSVFDKCRNEFGKRVCYLDISKSGHTQWDPDPRCPNSEDVNLIL